MVAKKKNDAELDDELEELEKGLVGVEDEDEDEEDGKKNKKKSNKKNSKAKEEDEDEDEEESETDEEDEEVDEDDEEESENDSDDDDENEETEAEEEESEDDDEGSEDGEDESENGEADEDSEEEAEEDDEEKSGSSSKVKTGMVKISEIVIPKKKVRVPTQEQIDEMASAIKSNGLLMPITITKAKILVDGLVRLMAHKKLGKKEIYCDVVNIPKEEVFYYSGVQNYVRNNMSPKEEAVYIKELLKDKERFPTQKALAKQLGVSEAKITRSLQEIGEAKEYNSEKIKKNKAKKQITELKRKSQVIGKEIVPEGIEIRLAKDRLIVAFDIPIKGPKHVKRFDVQKEILAVIKKIKSSDLREEMIITRKSL